MEKLEFKHIAPYLPYSLGIKILNYQCDYVGIEYSVITGCYHIGVMPHFNYEGGSTGKSFDEFIPILRPLSDFTKEIEHNVRSFVPTNEIKNIDGEYYITLDSGCLWLDDVCSLGFEATRSYSLITTLFEWHFDVFGLIEKGLAIDINTFK